jgi:hypothetical protein
MSTVSMMTAGCLSDSRHYYNGISSKTEFAPLQGDVIQNNTDDTFSILLSLLHTNYSELNVSYSNDINRVIAGKRIGIQHTTDYLLTTIKIKLNSITMETNYSRDNTISVPKDKDFNATILKAYNIDLNLTRTHNQRISSFIIQCYPVQIQNETYLKKESWWNS